MRDGCISIYKVALQPSPKAAMEVTKVVNNTGANSNMVVSNSTAAINRVVILVASNKDTRADNSNKTTITIMTSWRSWLSNSCPRLSGSWRAAVLSCNRIRGLDMPVMPDDYTHGNLVALWLYIGGQWLSYAGSFRADCSGIELLVVICKGYQK